MLIAILGVFVWLFMLAGAFLIIYIAGWPWGDN